MRALALLAAVLLAGCAAPPQAPASTRMAPDLAPEMGWNGWYYFGEKIHPDVIRAAAKALVRSGLADLGYTLVQIDGGWWTQGNSPGRDAAGRIVPDPEFADMKGLVDELHAMGLRAGIYTDLGATGCGTQWGSGGHYAQDVAQFAEWGFDHVKVDFCGGLREGLDARTAYRAFRAAMDAHPGASRMRLNVCEWGYAAPWEWAGGFAHSWRTGSDIAPDWVTWENVLRNFRANDHPEAAGPGRWNDPDHVVVGVWEGNLTDAESRAHFSMWAIQAAPLMLATNVLALSPQTLQIVGNAEVIEVAQDALGKPGRRAIPALFPGVEVWVREVSGGLAVLVLNTGESTVAGTLPWVAVGMERPGKVRDLWAHADRAPGEAGAFHLPPHGAAMWRLSR